MSPVTGVSRSSGAEQLDGVTALARDGRDGLAHVAGADDGEVCHEVLLEVGGDRLVVASSNTLHGLVVPSSNRLRCDPWTPRWLEPRTSGPRGCGWSRSSSCCPGVLDAQLRRDSGLTHFEYFVLAMLSEAPERTPADDGPRPPHQRHAAPPLARRRTGSRRAAWSSASPAPRTGGPPTPGSPPAGWDAVVAAAPGHVETVRQHVLDPLTRRPARAAARHRRRPADPARPRGQVRRPAGCRRGSPALTVARRPAQASRRRSSTTGMTRLVRSSYCEKPGLLAVSCSQAASRS